MCLIRAEVLNSSQTLWNNTKVSSSVANKSPAFDVDTEGMILAKCSAPLVSPKKSLSGYKQRQLLLVPEGSNTLLWVSRPVAPQTEARIPGGITMWIKFSCSRRACNRKQETQAKNWEPLLYQPSTETINITAQLKKQNLSAFGTQLAAKKPGELASQQSTGF